MPLISVAEDTPETLGCGARFVGSASAELEKKRRVEMQEVRWN